VRRPIFTLDSDAFDAWWAEGHGWDHLGPDAGWSEVFEDPTEAAHELLSVPDGPQPVAGASDWTACAYPLWWADTRDGLLLTARRASWSPEFQLATRCVSDDDLREAFTDPDRAVFPRVLIEQLNTMLTAVLDDPHPDQPTPTRVG
jgi:hypothetical protein